MKMFLKEMILLILILNFALIESGGFGRPVLNSKKKPKQSLSTQADRPPFFDSKFNKASSNFSIRRLKADQTNNSNGDFVPELKLFQDRVLACIAEAHELIVNLMAFKEEKISKTIESTRASIFQNLLARTFFAPTSDKRRGGDGFVKNVDEIIQSERKRVQQMSQLRFDEFLESKNNTSPKEVLKLSNHVSKILQDYFDVIFDKISSLGKQEKHKILNEVDEIRSSMNTRLGYNAQFMSYHDLELVDLKINQELVRSTHILMSEERNALVELKNVLDRHKTLAKQLVESFVKRMSAMISEKPPYKTSSTNLVTTSETTTTNKPEQVVALTTTNEAVKTLKNVDKPTKSVESTTVAIETHSSTLATSTTMSSSQTTTLALDEPKKTAEESEESPIPKLESVVKNHEEKAGISSEVPKLVRVNQFYTEINGEPAQVKQFSLLGALKGRKQGTSKNLSSNRKSNEKPFYFNDGYVCIKMKYHDYKAYEDYLKTLF